MGKEAINVPDGIWLCPFRKQTSHQIVEWKEPRTAGHRLPIYQDTETFLPCIKEDCMAYDDNMAECNLIRGGN